MNIDSSGLVKKIWMITLLVGAFFLLTLLLGISIGSSGRTLFAVFEWLAGKADADPMLNTIIWQIRLPRVLLAAMVGASLSMGGLVFQALLRNPLAEPYILGISGGAAIGAIIGILLGMTRFPGVTFTAFAGSCATLALLLMMTSGSTILRKDALLLSGVMVNAFCSALIMFLVSITQDDRLHNIIFWLMGDMGMVGMGQVGILAGILLPCFILFFLLSNALNLMVMGKETALAMGLNVRVMYVLLLVTTSIMISASVSYSGLIGFVGLVMPHLLRIVLGSDHRVLVPACIFGGGGYMILCDLLARSLPRQGEMPAGVITALVGAPLFIYLLKRAK